MKKRKQSFRFLKVIGTALAGLIAAAALFLLPVSQGAAAAAETETASGSSGEQQLIITVVEDIAAEEIEENAVPLAALPDSQNRNGERHIVLMAVVLLCVLAYVLYFGRYEKKLAALRQSAVKAEYERMETRRKQNADRDGEKKEK